MKLKNLISFALLACCSLTAQAELRYRGYETQRIDSLAGTAARVSWQTNLVDWALLSPSLGMDIDLGEMQKIGALSLYLQGKYISPQSTNIWLYPNESDRWSGRAELRWHFPYRMFTHRKLDNWRSFWGVFAEPRMAGLSAGYDFPGFGYKNRHFWQFQLGAGVGVSYTPSKGNPVYPELRLALVHRAVDIRRKYHQLSKKVVEMQIQQHREAEVMADRMLTEYAYITNIFIDVKKLNKKKELPHPITKRMAIDAICRQTGMNLESSRFGGECDTIFPIRQLGDYNITYNFPTAGDEEGTDVNVRFRVELEGRREAEAVKQSLVDALQKYHDEKGLPALYARAQAKSTERSIIEGHLPLFEVQTLFSRIWGKPVEMNQLKDVSFRPVAGILQPITDQRGLNRRGRYAVRIVFHPEVELNYDTDPILSQFEVKFRGESSSAYLYERLNGEQYTLQRSWEGSNRFSPEITVDDIHSLLLDDGIRIKKEVLQMDTTVCDRFNQRYYVSVFLNAGYVARFSFVVIDEMGLEKSRGDMKRFMDPWIKRRQWATFYVDREEDMHMIDPRKFREVLSREAGYTFREYQILSYAIDNKFELLPDGRYRAYARIQLHPDNSQVLRVPYYIIVRKSGTGANASAEGSTY